VLAPTTTELLPVPAVHGDLVRVTTAGDFIVSESCHRAPIPMHAHPRATVTIPIEGAFEERYAGRGRSEICGRWSVLYRPPAAPHADRFGREGVRNLVIEIDAGRLGTLRDRDILPEEVAVWRTGTLASLARRMRAELSMGDAMAPLALEGLSLELLAELRRERPGAGGASTLPAWLGRARDLLHARAGGTTPRIANIAAEVGVHPVYLARAFRARYGVTPGAYLRRLRLEAAMAELAGTDTLARIAHRAGFSDQSHFTRAFKAAFGTAPGQWRANRRGGPRAES
jgi:AraC family transcriptional regulator